MRKNLKRVAIATALTVAATTGISSPASAADYASYKSRRTNGCLQGNSAGTVFTATCTSATSQDWDLQFISGTSYYLKNRSTGQCLDANSANSAYTLSCNGGTNQRWRRVYEPGDSVYGQWINIQTGKCLTENINAAGNPPLYTSVCTNDLDNQVIRWARV